MLDFIDTWSNDHRNFAHLLNILEAEVDSFLNAKPVRYDLMLDILHYMTHYPDIFHHPKEDLVSARVKELDASAGAVVDELTRQHVVLRQSGAKLFELLEEVMGGAMLKRQSIEAPARAYYALPQAHGKGGVRGVSRDACAAQQKRPGSHRENGAVQRGPSVRGRTSGKAIWCSTPTNKAGSRDVVTGDGLSAIFCGLVEMDIVN